LGVASLVLGILGTVFSIFPGLFWVGIPIAVIALVLGIVSRKAAVTNQQPTGVPTAGLVLGVIGLAIGVVMWVLCGVLVRSAQRGFEKALKDPEVQKRLNDAKLNKDFNDAFNKALEESEKKKEKP
jgi:lysylphosphatidylglycerol synthetase-like protein (DUF2156 family)